MRLPQPLLALGSPGRFYMFAGKVAPWLAGLAGILFCAGAVGGLVLAPADHQQGEGYRVIFVHVPAAWLSLLVYLLMASWAILVLVWRSKVAATLMVSSATLGASFTALTLLSGSLWGKPMWGTWWAWDARLTSELILLFLYLGYIALQQALPQRQAACRAGAVLILIGVVNIPIIHFSVDWWHTLHQPATISKFAAPSIDTSMLVPLVLMAGAFMCYFSAACLWRARAELLAGEAHARWAQEAVVHG